MKRNVTKCKFNNTWNDILRCRTATILLNMNMHRLESAHKFSTKNNKISRENNNKNNNITEMRRSRKIRCQDSNRVCVCVQCTSELCLRALAYLYTFLYFYNFVLVCISSYMVALRICLYVYRSALYSSSEPYCSCLF